MIRYDPPAQIMLSKRDTCRDCGAPLDNPLAQARGHCQDCGDGSVEK